MNLRRFYTERTKLRVGSSVRLPDSENTHIRNSLRMVSGDEIILFNGQREFKATLYKVTKEVVMANITEELNVDKNLSDDSPVITLFQGIIKVPQFELIVEKTTELGVSEIVPVACEFSQLKHAFFTGKFPRMQKIIMAACKQSERVSIPQLAEIHEFEQMLDRVKEFDLFLFCTIARGPLSEYAEQIRSIKNIIEGETPASRLQKIAIAIGPEGGFSPTEHKKFLPLINDKVQMVSITEGILRAETAAIAAVTALVL